MFWKESLFISVLFYYYDFLSGVFFCLFVSNYWLDLCFIFQFVPFDLVHLTYSVLFCVASHGQGLSASSLGVLGEGGHPTRLKTAIEHKNRRKTPKMSYWAGCSDSSGRIISALFEKPLPSVSWRLLESVWLSLQCQLV